MYSILRKTVNNASRWTSFCYVLLVNQTKKLINMFCTLLEMNTGAVDSQADVVEVNGDITR